MPSHQSANTHSITMGYILWIFGFIGAHRFYYGKPLTGLLWLCTGGFFLIGWIVDLFLIPGMDREADYRYSEGPLNYNAMWILLTFIGFLGIHRLFMEKYISGVIYLVSGGLFGIGVVYDFFTLNGQIDEFHKQSAYRQRRLKA